VKNVLFYALDQDRETTATLGVFHYTRRLLQAMAAEPDPGFRVTIVASAANRADLAPDPLPAWMTVLAVAGRYHVGLRRLWGDHAFGPFLILRSRADLVHYPKGWLPVLRPARVGILATLHDAIVCDYPARYPGHLPAHRQLYFQRAVLRALHHCDRIITVSDYSRTRFATLCPAAAARIAVIGEGPAIEPPPGPPSLPREGVLVLGSRMPHKATRQTLALLDDFARQRTPLRVVVTGLSAWPPDWGSPPRHLRTEWVGRIPDGSLAARLRGARALVFLSELEGFGLPLLDAYAAETPVCYRNATSLKEVMRGEPGGWNGEDAVGFEKALDETLALSADAVRGIRDRLLARYSWPAAAKQTLQVYREELAKHE
jgi:glycosyltransferase involved in cell wall biosynthesis